MNNQADNSIEELKKYGVPETSIKPLQSDAPEMLDYLDLIDESDERLMPNFVVESQDRPLLFVVSEDIFAPRQETDYYPLCHTLACRGQRAYLAVLRHGELCVFPVETTQNPKSKVYKADSDEALAFFPRLALGHYDGQGDNSRRDFVFEKMLKLLNDAANSLSGNGIGQADVLSFVGRALFFRFLYDREIIKENDITTIAPKAQHLDNCFDDLDNTLATCQWLDKTFNGNFLSLSTHALSTLFREMGQDKSKRAFEPLKAIARGHESAGSGNYQSVLRFDHWTDFNFAHIPVGLLSQVYEIFAHEFDTQAHSTSVYYTPRNIASTLVDMVFQGLPNAAVSRILDPACGAGVFLVLAFRRLYREHWQATGTRPATQEIRKILMEQITGFDISDSALKFAALSLYLTAIELDPNPTPPEKLKFEDLNNTVLYNWRRENEQGTGVVAGSLNPKNETGFDGKFDIVLSNPPWTALEEKSLASDFNKLSKDIIKRRGQEEFSQQYTNPDKSPDLPFLWKSTEWCKPNGRIAMALPARILLKQTPVPCKAREVLFRLIEVNGIVNGSNLSDTPVWQGMAQPFMLLLATNCVPRKGYTLHFITPHYDAKLNQRGEMWIDSNSTIPVSPEVTFNDPWLWKALTLGTALDIEIIRKIKSVDGLSLIDYWEKQLGLVSKSGYQVAEDQPNQQDARLLQGLPNLTSTNQFRFVVNSSLLNPFSRDKVLYTRLADKGDKLQVYRAPLVLFKAAPGIDRQKGRAIISFQDVAYNESYYGYSSKGHNDAELLARYIQLFAHSDLWMYYSLLTSAQFGAERRKFHKSDFDNCCVLPLESLTPEQKQTILLLSERLIQGDTSVFEEIDTFFAQLYRLDELDIQVIRDTLEVCLPYMEVRQRACKPPTSGEHERFRQQLESLLCPFFNVIGKQLNLTFWQPSTGQSPKALEKTPFKILLIGTQTKPVPPTDELLWLQIVQLANETGATRIFLEIEGGLAVALLNQYRYWTPTRTRLCAAEIIRRFMHIFEDR